MPAPGRAVSKRTVNNQQAAAIAARGEVFVSAGAGTGKTTVLVERFVRAVCDEGLDVESVLVITYTRKAAAELRGRIRAALLERGRDDLARRLDGAWVSTIHGFCARLLRAHPFAVGIDPRFRELDEQHGAVIRGEAFDRALAAFCASGSPDRLRLLTTYGTRRLRRMLTGVYETLRSAGRPLVLVPDAEPDLASLLAELREAAETLAADTAATAGQRDAARAAIELPGVPERLLDLERSPGSRRSRGDLRGGAQARRAGRARARRGPRPRAAPGAARPVRSRVREREGARVGARLRGPPARRARPARRRRACPRGRAAALPHDHGRRVPGHERTPVRAGRPARGGAGEGRLLRRRRVPVDLRLPARRRRGVPRAACGGGAAAAADAELPLPARGARGRQLPLRAGVRRRVPAARGLGRVPGPGLRSPRRAARDRQGVVSRGR